MSIDISIRFVIVDAVWDGSQQTIMDQSEELVEADRLFKTMAFWLGNHAI